jgi:hypothetical protein
VENINIVIGIILSLLYITLLIFEMSAFNYAFWTNPGSVPEWWIDKARKLMDNNQNSSSDSIAQNERESIVQPLLENGFPIPVANSFHTLNKVTICQKCNIPRPARFVYFRFYFLILIHFFCFLYLDVTIGLYLFCLLVFYF